MKVSGIGGARGPSDTRKTGRTGRSETGSFARHLASATDRAEGPAPVESAPAISGIDALLAAQSVGDALEQEQRQRLVSYGETLLDRLEEVRRGLILGTIPRGQLTGLAGMIREQRERAQDPRLAAILGDIELRAEVELAKLARNADNAAPARNA